MANCIRCGRQLPGFTFGKKVCQWCLQHEAAQRGELADDAPQPVIRRPWVSRGESTIGVTQVIFGLNAAVFVGMVLSSSSVMDFPGGTLVHWGANVGALTFSFIEPEEAKAWVDEYHAIVASGADVEVVGINEMRLPAHCWCCPSLTAWS